MPVNWNFDVNIDLLGIWDRIQHAVSSHLDRGAWTQHMRDTVYYALGGRYNVMVANRRQNPTWYTIENVQFYRGVQYDGTTFGIWAFAKGTFRLNGEKGYENWAFAANWHRHGEGDKNVDFNMPAALTHTVVKGETLYDIALNYGTSVDNIKQHSGIADADKISPGQVLNLRPKNNYEYA